MKKMKIKVVFTTLLCAMIIGCTSNPVAPEGGFPVDSLPPPIQDPGVENLCAEDIISFQHQVLPILVSSCAYSGCHDAQSAEDGIVLDSYENVIKEVKPRDPGDSELYESITETDRDDIMPPPPAAPLSNSQIGLIRNWILQGAENTDCGAPCNPESSSFANIVFPLLQDYCIGCHNTNRMDGGVDISTYNQILPYVNNGSLIGTIKAEQYYPVMPPSGSQLSQCRITQIEKWIAEGAQNN